MKLHGPRARVRAGIAVVAAAGLVALVLGVQPAEAAARHISVSIVGGNAGTLKVTGTGFSKRSTAHVVFEQNGFNGGNLMQDFTVTTDGNGRFKTTQKAYVTSACLVGVSAHDAQGESNGVDLNTKGKGCSGGKLSIVDCVPFCNKITIKGSGFTPGADVGVFVDVVFDDGSTFSYSFDTVSCGTLAPGPFPGGDAGKLALPGFACTGAIRFDSRFCHAKTITATAFDDVIDYETVTVGGNQRCS
jgi:hypothetical protein